MTEIKKNFVYNLFYQGLILLLPLITVPYISRKLGVEGIGIYSYTYSIVYYFMLISMLGINNYGNRTIAKSKEDKKLLSQNFISIYSIQLFMTILMIIIYIIYIYFFCKKYTLISEIQIIYLISVLFDLNWFFFGMEKFKITVTRSTIIKIISVILIFKFVKSQDDLSVYVLIMSCSTLLTQLVLIPYLLKEIKIEKIQFSNIKKHILPCLVLFIPYISVSLYKIMDKIMLGNMSTIMEVGFYEQAEKIINIPTGIISALGTVMLPRISNLLSKGNKKIAEEYIKKSIKFIMFISFPICFGLIAISTNFVQIFLGDSFYKTSILIYYLSPTILFLSFANVIRTQFLIPNEKDKDFTYSLIGGAIINLIINYLLIPKYKSIGAAIGTFFAELFVCLYQTITVRNDLPIKEYLKSIYQFLIKTIIMFIIVFPLNLINTKKIYIIVLQITIGVVAYVLINKKYIEDILNIRRKHERANKKNNT